VKTAARAVGIVSAGTALLAASAIAVAGPVKTSALHGGVVHAEITQISAAGVVKEVVLDRGEVTASSPSSISLKRADGPTVTLAVTAATKVRGTVVVGKRALVLSRDGTALVVRARHAGLAGLVGLGHGRLALRAGVHADIDLIKADGSTDSFAFDRGEIAGKTSSSLTLKRKDGKSVTLSVDTATKVRATGKAVTLASLSVGQRAQVFSRGGAAFLIRAFQKRAE
jgi:hypothetical protein